MTQPTFEIQSASLVGDHARHVDEVRQHIMAQLQTLIQDLEPVSTQWMGTAGSAFQRLKSDYTERHTGVDRVLGQIAGALSVNQNTYSTAEADSQQTMTQINAATSSIVNTMNPQI